MKIIKSMIVKTAVSVLFFAIFLGTQVHAAAFINPLPGGRMTQGFGDTRTFNPAYPTCGNIRYFHNGVDYSTGRNSAVVSSAQGTVKKIAYDKYLGNYVMIRHVVNGTAYVTQYAHLNSVLVTVGQVVSQGQQIGVEGKTGNVSGPTGIHLHFGIFRDGAESYCSALNPLNFIGNVTYVPGTSTTPTSGGLAIGDVVYLDNNMNVQVSVVSAGVQPDGRKVYGIKYPNGTSAVALATRLHKVGALATGDIVKLDNNAGNQVAVLKSAKQADGQVVYSIKYPNGTTAVSLATRLYKVSLMGPGAVAKLDNNAANQVAILKSGKQADGQVIYSIKYPNGTTAVAVGTRLYPVQPLQTGDVVKLDNNTANQVAVLKSSKQADGQVVYSIKYPNGTTAVSLATRLYEVPTFRIGDVVKLDNNPNDRVTLTATGVQSDGQVVYGIKYPNGTTAVSLATRLYR